MVGYSDTADLVRKNFLRLLSFRVNQKHKRRMMYTWRKNKKVFTYQIRFCFDQELSYNVREIYFSYKYNARGGEEHHAL